MTRVVLFPGQGVQRPGMGADLFERYPSMVAQADEILGYSLRQLCLGDETARLARTEFAQPAVYVVSALALQAHLETSPSPDIVLGHSLGEYNALHAAGAFTFAEGLALVKARAAATAQVSGAMLAVVGLRQQHVEEILAAAGTTQVYIANVNSSRQLVLAGPVHAIDTARSALDRADARLTQLLRISGPFHSPHMAPAAKQFAPAVEAARLQAPDIPVIANLTARPHQLANLRRALVEHLTNPVLWQQSVEWLWQEYGPPQDDLGEPAAQQPPAEPLHLTELGKGNVLTKLIGHICSERQESTGKRLP
ncbi:acyltransferase [Streptomyces alboflavus]|uniref:Malonyl CoA-acyl carrier protein transacylase n=1 Tax=Streptomyces alboflavus TaxID=67267 RepID=A0A1Z1W2K0_9ACTN|nr:ACP S-malonyltransferase [Streptomyces alboflavus]ARX80648.1 acyltransferase [Streptomyces alboflavus]